MKKNKTVLLLLSVILLIATLMISCKQTKEKVTIYTSTEDYNMEYMQKCFDKQFPDYEIVIEYMSTSNIAAKIIEEGSASDCDIIYAEEYGYLEKMADANVLESIKGDYDLTRYAEDAITDSLKDYALPAIRTGGAVIINNAVLSSHGIKIPVSYEDLLKPEYKGLISMASPKSSGTGYMFYFSLVKAWGEEKALNYFKSLTPNVLSYTTSGSGPVNALMNREVAVGFGMISQAVNKINDGNNELSILFFKEGAPFNLYGNAIVKGKKQRKAVKDVMDYLDSFYTDESCGLFYPEPVFKNRNYQIANFPENIEYSDMTGNNLNTKEKLLSLWKY